jgi:hypothetical protein
MHRIAGTYSTGKFFDISVENIIPSVESCRNFITILESLFMDQLYDPVEFHLTRIPFDSIRPDNTVSYAVNQIVQ